MQGRIWKTLATVVYSEQWHVVGNVVGGLPPFFPPLTKKEGEFIKA